MPRVLDYRLHAQWAGITNEPPINTVTEVKLHLLPRTRTQGVMLTSNCQSYFWRNKLASTFHTCF